MTLQPTGAWRGPRGRDPQAVPRCEERDRRRAYTPHSDEEPDFGRWTEPAGAMERGRRFSEYNVLGLSTSWREPTVWKHDGDLERPS